MDGSSRVNEVPPQTRARPEVATWAGGGSSPTALLTRGWATALRGGGLAFAVMVIVGQALAFAVNLAEADGASAGSIAKLGWLYFGWFHHLSVPTHLVTLDQGAGGSAALSGHADVTTSIGLAMMLATFLAIALLYRGGRAVADQEGGGLVARIMHGMKVAPAYAIPPLVVSWLVRIDIPIPRNALAAGSVQMRSWGVAWFVIPFLIAAAAGACGGLRSGRHELLSNEPWGPRAAGAVVGGLRMFILGLVLSFVGLLVLGVVQPHATKTYFGTVSRPSTQQTAVIIAHHVLLLPNQSMWVLVPAMGGCDGVSGGGISASFLCYTKFPTTGQLSPESLISGAPAVRTDFGTAPPGYFLFLLVPALSVVLGGRYAARKRAQLRWEAIALGAASGVVFAVLVAVGSWLASVSVGLSSPTGGAPENSSILIGPGALIPGVLALAWGVVGGGFGGWLGGRELPPRAQLRAPSSLSTWRAEDAAGPSAPGTG